MKALTIAALAALILLTPRCSADGGENGGAVLSSLPVLGPADGMDSPDVHCQVVLRDAARPLTEGGHERAPGGRFLWRGSLQVSRAVLDEGGEPHVLFSTSLSGGEWYETAAAFRSQSDLTATYDFTIDAFTPGEEWDMGAFRISLVPFLRLPGGWRVFDHNRNPGLMDNYELGPENGWRLTHDPDRCVPENMLGKVVYPDYFEELGRGPSVEGGPLVQGRVMEVHFYRDRFASFCGGEAAGLEAEAFVQFSPGGGVERAPLADAPGEAVRRGMYAPVRFDIPSGAQSAAMWFRALGPDGSLCYDSRYGANYVMPVLDGTQQVGWAGGWQKVYVTRPAPVPLGLPEPLMVSGWDLTRGGIAVEAEVYVPGLTDTFDGPGGFVIAQGVFDDQVTGEHFERALEFVGRRGNNYVYRSNLGFIFMEGIVEYAFYFRFSLDGESWFRIATQDGPEGGPARHLVPAAW